jgi:biotin operon repressor
MEQQTIERLQIKTAEQRFLSVLEKDFHKPPRVAQALLEEAQACLFGSAQHVRPGQMRVILARRDAGHGRGLAEIPMIEVIWTVDAGLEDLEVLQEHGRPALRQAQILRLANEALDQGAVATQEDLAQALQVSVRTVKRHCAYLQAQGVEIPTRGNVQGIGRGQTHKAQIVGRWLRGETYDQIALHTRHSLSSIRRYVQTFARVVHLHRRGWVDDQIATLLGIGSSLVAEYLAIYRENDSPACRQRLEAQLTRLLPSEVPPAGKKGGS